jgi:hypothetical protein
MQSLERRLLSHDSGALHGIIIHGMA